jgi:hypothetical protein
VSFPSVRYFLHEILKWIVHALGELLWTRAERERTRCSLLRVPWRDEHPASRNIPPSSRPRHCRRRLNSVLDEA